MTARDLVRRSLMLLGVLSDGESPSASQLADGFSSLTEMIESWCTERLLHPNRIRQELILVPGQQTYTIGLLGDFNTQRPSKIEFAASLSGDVEMPIDIVTEDEWALITSKNQQSSLPAKLFYKASYPLGEIMIWPVPSEARTLVIESLKSTPNLADVNSVVNLPEGYIRALRYNLAIELAPEFGVEPSGALVRVADESKANIKRNNIKALTMTTDVPVGQKQSFNVLTGV